MKPEKFILDATAGKRMIWFNKEHPNCVYLDQNPEVKPDVVGDFCNLREFNDNTFRLVVFDPPHQQYSKNAKGIFAKTYGRINTSSIHLDFYLAFRELKRILKPYGILILKWNDHDVEVNKILNLADGWRPLFGHKTAYKLKHKSQTFWFCFMKIPDSTFAIEKKKKG